MKKFKIMLSVFMVLVIIAVSVAPVFAEDSRVLAGEMSSDKIISPNEEYTVSNEDDGPYNNDKKIFCTATIEEDFDEDSLLVVLKNEASLDFENYSTPEFSGIEAKSINEITSYKTEKIHSKFEAKKAEFTTALKEAVSSDNAVSRSSLSSFVADGKLTAIDNKIIEENATALSMAEIEEEYSGFHKIIYIELDTKDKQNVLDTIKELEENEDVLAVSPNYQQQYEQETAVTSSTDYDPEWAQKNISLTSAWNITKGSSSVKVGIIDDGIDASHPDLAGNYDATLSKTFTDAPANESLRGHGTKVAGIIGAVGDNSIGIKGVCWDVSLVSLQVRYSDLEWELSNTISAISYADEMEIPIINQSQSMKILEETSVATLETAIRNYDGIFIAAAGNQYADIDAEKPITNHIYPSRLESLKIISVASIDSENNLAHDSNYGKTSVDLAAPGYEVYSTVNENGKLYDKVYGTSCAAPYVAGVAALIKSKYPTITNYGIRKAILDSVVKVSSLDEKVRTEGKLNAYAALQAVGDSQYTVVYNANGGSGTMANTTVTYGFFTSLRDLAFTKPLHNFIGWDAYRMGDGTHRYKCGDVEKWCIEGEQPDGYVKALYSNQAQIAHTSGKDGDTIIMTAQWEPYMYTIVFNKNGATSGSMSNLRCEFNKNITIPGLSMSYPGYTFDGWEVYRYLTDSEKVWLYNKGNTYNWYTKGSQPDGYSITIFRGGETFYLNEEIREGVVLYFDTKWEPISYTITYDSNGGVGSMADTIGYTDENVQLRNNTFTKARNIFRGWYLVDSDGYWSTTHEVEWILTPPQGYDIKLYADGSYVNCEASYEGFEITAIAQWLLLGDVDLDGVISVMDATLIQMYFSQASELTDEQISCGDFDEDGYFTIMDATAIQMYLSSTN